MKVYHGMRLGPDTASEVEIFVTDAHGPGKPLVHRVRHSPTGMNWGYSGSGPADLARSILWDALDREPEPSLYQAFKSKFVAGWEAEWSIDEPTIIAWVASIENPKYADFGRRVFAILDGKEWGGDQLEEIGQAAAAAGLKLRAPEEVTDGNKG